MTKFCFGFWSVALTLLFPVLNRAAEPIVVFGLTNVPIGQAVLVGNVVTNVGELGADGVSIVLGEADAGVFAYPVVDHNPQSGDYMIGKVYGKLNGVANELIGSVQGRTQSGPNGFGVYPVTVDLSALGVTNYLAQVFTRGGRLVMEREIGLIEPIMRTDYNGYRVERVNPFWRTPAGGIAVVIEFHSTTGFELAGDEEEEEDDSQGSIVVFGTRLVLHALNPTGAVEFVSRVDVTTGTDGDSPFNSFQMTEMRPGVFGRAHKALGEVVLEPRLGSLRTSRLDPGAPESASDFVEGTGVHIEMVQPSSVASVSFQPVDLSTNSEIGVTAMGNLAGFYNIGYLGPQLVGTVRLRRGLDGMVLDAYLPSLGTNASQVVMAVFRGGKQVGATPMVEGEQFPLASVSGSPRVVRGTAQANTTNSFPGIGLALDSAVTFTVTVGVDTLSFTGDEVRFLLVGTNYREPNPYQVWLESVEAVMVNSRGLTGFTISGESEVPLVAPVLSFARAGGLVQLSWPDPNRAYHPLSTTNVLRRVNEWSSDVDYTNPTATLSINPTNAARFYRLVHLRAADE